MEESSERSFNPSVDRGRFIAAAGLFLAWVVVLGVLAVFSSRRPEPIAPAAEKP